MDSFFLLLLLWIGLSVGGARVLVEVLREDRRRKNKSPQLPGDRVPALPPRTGGPYRESAAPDSQTDLKQDDALEGGERFRRFVYASTRLKSQVSSTQLQSLANELDLALLAQILEDAEPNSPRLNAAVKALSVRTDPEDIDELLELLFETEWHHVVDAILLALRERGPVTEEVISAIYDIVYSDDDDNNAHARRLAEDILDEWEQKYPETISRFVLLK